MSKGKLIVIDGIDGSGKATQTKILTEKINSLGFKVETLDFPQYENNFFGKMVRRYLDGEFGVATKVSPYLASILYAADRFESSEKIKEWLLAGKIVILDRYYTSNLIHQSAKLKEEEFDEYISWLEKMEFNIFKIPKPDLVLYLHLPAKIAYDWISKRGQGHDGHDTLQHLIKAENQCLKLVEIFNWKKIDCAVNDQTLAIPEISDLIFTEIKNLI